MNHLIFDIETGTSENSRIFMPEFTEPKTKTAKSADEKRQEWVEKTPLNVLTGQILAIGCRTYSEADELIDTSEFILTATEEANIKDFWSFYDSSGYVVGFNIKKFDLPYIVRRGYLYGIKPLWDYTDRYNPKIIDLMERWGQGIYQEYVSLNDLCKYFNIPEKKHSGAEFQKLFKEDREEAIEYLRGDIERTYQIAKKMFII